MVWAGRLVIWVFVFLNKCEVSKNYCARQVCMRFRSFFLSSNSPFSPCVSSCPASSSWLYRNLCIFFFGLEGGGYHGRFDPLCVPVRLCLSNKQSCIDRTPRQPLPLPPSTPFTPQSQELPLPTTTSLSLSSTSLCLP